MTMTHAPQLHQQNYDVEKLLLFPRSSAVSLLRRCLFPKSTRQQLQCFGTSRIIPCLYGSKVDYAHSGKLQKVPMQRLYKLGLIQFLIYCYSWQVIQSLSLPNRGTCSIIRPKNALHCREFIIL
jgi:hypothetical protein